MENKHKVAKAITIIIIILIVGIFVVPSIAYVEDSYTGEFIRANKIYMPNNNINLVVYFNESSNTHFLIFEDWDASHSVQLSNLVEGDEVKIWYRDFVFGVRTIVEIEVL